MLTVAAEPGGVNRDQISEIQRGRLLSAMVEVVNERRLADATIARIVARAGVSRRTFYDLFDDRDQCFLAALDDAIDRATAGAISACQSTSDWTERTRRALAALLGFLDGDRSTARFLLVGSLGAGAGAYERRQKALATLITAIDQGRHRAKVDPPPLAAEGVVGGALTILQSRVHTGAPLTALHPQLMSMIVMPYKGPTAARRELTRHATPPISTTTPPTTSNADILRELPIRRLTYRTTRVLIHLAEHPGSSNRQISAATGIPDQGQASKLLHRLQRLDLIENTSSIPHQGTPNAWRLTAEGHRAQHAINTNARPGASGGASRRGASARNGD